jgi:hypothetical protein
MRVVGATPQLQILRAGLATDGERQDVMELEQPGLRTSSLSAHKRTAPFIARPHGALDGGRNVSSG